MSQPTKSDVHVNTPLSQVSIAYMQQPGDFIAGLVFPNVPVTHQSDRYFSYAKKGWFKTEAQKRAPGSESAGSGFDIDNSPTYFADVWAVHKDIPDQVRGNADVGINIDSDATKWVTRQMLLRQEKQFVSKYFTTSIWAEDFTPGTLWDAGGSTPITDIKSKMNAVKLRTGYKPNILVVGPQVHTTLENHATVLDRIKYTQTAVLTEGILASLFGVDRYLVASAVEDTAAEGATATNAFMFGKNALLVYAAPQPSLMEPSGGYIFSWTGQAGNGPQGNRIKSFRMEHLASDRVEGEHSYDMKVVGSDLGVFFSSVIA